MPATVTLATRDQQTLEVSASLRHQVLLQVAPIKHFRVGGFDLLNLSVRPGANHATTRVSEQYYSHAFVTILLVVNIRDNAIPNTIQ